MKHVAWVLVSTATIFATAASAEPIVGEFNIAGSMQADAGGIDFLDSSGGDNTGGFITLQGATGYFSTIASTNLTSPYVGVVKDVDGNATNVTEFLSGFSAPGYAGLAIDLTGIEAPTAPACTGSEAANDSCSLGAFTLTSLGADGTALAMVVRGSVHDSAISDSLSELTGRYTTQSGQSISDLVTSFSGDGGIRVAYSANFNAPPELAEPGVLILLGIGLAASGMLRRRGGLPG